MPCLRHACAEHRGIRIPVALDNRDLPGTPEQCLYRQHAGVPATHDQCFGRRHPASLPVFPDHKRRTRMLGDEYQ
jgi:hypothetical protein